MPTSVRLPTPSLRSICSIYLPGCMVVSGLSSYFGRVNGETFRDR